MHQSYKTIQSLNFASNPFLFIKILTDDFYLQLFKKNNFCDVLNLSANKNKICSNTWIEGAPNSTFRTRSSV